MSDRPNHYASALKLVPGDYLHLIPGENKLSILSQENLEDIIRTAKNIGIKDIDGFMKVIKEFEFMISGGLLARCFFEKRISFDINDQGELVFFPLDKEENNE